MSEILISSTKVSALNTIIQGNPEIGATDATWLSGMISRAARWLVRECNLKQYPEHLQGYSQSHTSPSTDVSAAASNHFYLSVNGSPFWAVEPVLTTMTTGANIATELQRAIRAVEEEDYGFAEVTVAYASSLYTITSGKYGEVSAIQIRYDNDTRHLCSSLKLSPDYGGLEVSGGRNNTEFDDAVVALVEVAYRKIGFEGLQGGSAADGISFQCWDTDPYIKRFIQSHRRLFR
jgi:hypothetical protein